MTREELDSWGEAIEQDQAEVRDVGLAIDAERQIAGHPSDDPIGAEPAPEFFENQWHVRGRYYANEADAAFWRAFYAEQRRRTLARIARYEAEHAAAAAAVSEHAA
jgi:hypothetical protein